MWTIYLKWLTLSSCECLLKILCAYTHAMGSTHAITIARRSILASIYIDCHSCITWLWFALLSTVWIFNKFQNCWKTMVKPKLMYTANGIPNTDQFTWHFMHDSLFMPKSNTENNIHNNNWTITNYVAWHNLWRGSIQKSIIFKMVVVRIGINVRFTFKHFQLQVLGAYY